MAIQHKQVLTALCFVVGTGFGAVSEAALYDRGNGLIYDDVLNVTWMQDANLFKTQASLDSNLVSKIINTISSVNDSYGAHTLSQSDFDSASGKMTWYGASAWADYIEFGGYNDWRLPSNPVIGYGFFDFNFYTYRNADPFYRELAYYSVLGQKANELTYMYGIELNNNYCPWCDFVVKNNVATLDGYGNVVASFVNVPVNSQQTSNSFWLKQEYPAGYFGDYRNGPNDPNEALIYNLYWRDLSLDLKNKLNYAWLVRDGDIAAVPLPATIWLFGLGFFSLLGMRKK